VLGWIGLNRVDVFAIYVCCIADEGAATVSALSVTFFEANEFDF